MAIRSETIQVSGIRCERCVMRLGGALGNLDGLERFVPDLTVERIPEGSHWVVNEHPERVNRLIRAFLTTGESPATKEPR